MWTAILTALKALVAQIEQEAGTALTFLLSFLKDIENYSLFSNEFSQEI